MDSNKKFKPIKDNFVCENCLYLYDTECRRGPERKYIPSFTYWCGEGKWSFWSDRLETWEPFLYGEWIEE